MLPFVNMHAKLTIANTRVWKASQAAPLLADTLWNPLGDGQNAVATYTWDAKWDFVTTAITPTGQQTASAYAGTTGNSVWSAFGGDTTTFAYTTLG